MNEKEMLQDYLWNLKRGFNIGFDVTRDLMRGLSYKRCIPKSYWDSDKNAFMRFFCVQSCSKSELKKFHQIMVESIFSELQKEMYADNYFRLMHALVILKVSKGDKRFPDSKNMNYMYRIAYGLMEYDDGSEESYRRLHYISWCAAEAAKNR